MSVVANDRVDRRRRQTVEEALDHAVDIVTESGVGALSMSEVARRMGMRAPSLYKYFPSLHAAYDALFRRGLSAHQQTVRTATEEATSGVARLRAGARATVAWSVENPALAQLMFWRPVPGFEPSQDTFRESETDMGNVRAEFTAAVAAGELDPAADSAEAVRLWTVIISGLISQQMANEPGVPYETGHFTALTDDALDMFFARYHPSGGPDAAA